jgi:hypothetical protein
MCRQSARSLRRRIGKASVQANDDAVNGSSKGKYNTPKRPVKNEETRRVQ